MRRGLVAVLALVSGLQTLPGPVAAASKPEPGTAMTSGVSPSSRRPAEVPELTSETRRVVANPDGSHTATLSALPVRVRRGGGWVPVDTTLRSSAGGGVSPIATSVPVTFSGGGSAPLVRLEHDGKRLELDWPGPLPVPRLDGDTATYAEVMPGVDLRLTADAQGFRQVLVVKTREAARSPKLATLRFGLTTRGVSLSADKAGVLTAKDGEGAEVFQAAAPQMWDSPATTAGTTATAATTGRGAAGGSPRGARRAVGRVELSEKGLAVIPDRRLLTDPEARFPLHIDPDFRAGLSGWGEVIAQHPDGSYWGGDGDKMWDRPVAKVGYSNWESPAVTYRSYFLYDIGWLAGARVLSAEFNAHEVWAPSCDPRWVDLYHVGPIGPGLTWRNQPWAKYVGGRNVAFGYDGCGPNQVGWDNVGGAVAEALGAGPAVAFMLRAADEGDPKAWKKFDVNPSLIVRYNRPPAAPAGLLNEDGPCAVHPDQPYVNTAKAGLEKPRLQATVSDPDGGPVAAKFEWYIRLGRFVGSATTVMQPSGSPFRVEIPAGAFEDGETIAWRVQGWDGTDWGPWSSWCDVTVDQIRPDRAPGVSSAAYPENDIGGAIGSTGSFTLTAGGVADVVGYKYGLIDPPSAYVPATGLGDGATALVTPPEDGPHDLYVRSVDRAGNESDSYLYHFLVGAGTPPIGQWQLDGRAFGTDAPDSSGRGHHGVLSGSATGPAGAAWTTGRVGDALRFDGDGGHVAARGGASIRTDVSFTVAAWVRLDRADDGWHAAVSQDGDKVSAFFLQYAGDTHEWAFTMPHGDKADPAWDRVRSGIRAVPGVWTHLVGVYDAARREMRLYVDGRFAGSASHTDLSYHAAGAVQIGRAKFNGGPSDHWPGAVDEVRVYDRVLSDGRDGPGDAVTAGSEIHGLATAPTVDEGWWPLDEANGTSAAEASGNHRIATAVGGVTWVPGAVGGGAAAFDGGGELTTGTPVVRTDRSFTVTAMARLNAADTASRAVLSQDGDRTSGFSLSYDGDTGKWAFALPSADSDTRTLIAARSAASARAGEWTHLAGVYDAATEELRLYVNGTQAGSASGKAAVNAVGAFRIGRSKSGGQAGEFWAGRIDNVRAYTGVRTGDQIREESRRPVTRPATVRPGQLSRWNGHDGDHLVSTGPVPPGHYFESPLGLPAPDGAPDTRMLYSCTLNGGDEFVSLDPGCEGQSRLAELGPVYASPPEGVPAQAIYRCKTSDAGEHFVSRDAGCEGRTVQGRLGYTRAYAHLLRHVRPYHPGEHRTTTGEAPADYRPERSLGLVPIVAAPGTVPLMSCRAGEDEFTSPDAGCEGATVIRQIGAIWPEPPRADAVAVYRCAVTGSGERFDSLDPGCEGQTVQRALGYVLPRI